MNPKMRAALPPANPDELVDAPAPEDAAIASIQARLDTLAGARDAIDQAQDDAHKAVREAIIAWNATHHGSGIETPAAAAFIARAAFDAMVIPAEYVQGYRDAMAKVRQNLAGLISINADPFEPAAPVVGEGP